MHIRQIWDYAQKPMKHTKVGAVLQNLSIFLNVNV